jgi:lipopolysaccharide transport system ATP-binding protein
MYHVQKLCRHACWLRNGAIEMKGDVFDVSQAYLAYHERKSAPVESAADRAAKGTLEFSLLDVSLNGSLAEQPLLIDTGDTLVVRASMHSREGRIPCLAVGIVRADGTPVYGVATDMDGCIPQQMSANEFACEVQFSDLALLPGSYTVRVHPMDTEGVRVFDTVERGVTVRGASREFGMVRLAHRWNRIADDSTAP